VKDDAKYCSACGSNLSKAIGAVWQGDATGISPSDAQEIVEEVQRLYASVPFIARPMVPPMPQILQRIPACARKYTLQQIIDLLEEAHAQGLI
jgi:hypothetical protein